MSFSSLTSASGAVSIGALDSTDLCARRAALTTATDRTAMQRTAWVPTSSTTVWHGAHDPANLCTTWAALTIATARTATQQAVVPTASTVTMPAVGVTSAGPTLCTHRMLLGTVAGGVDEQQECLCLAVLVFRQGQLCFWSLTCSG
eukprot:CAMPEP_0203851400 /NCGR_PEP_ID=MMETSP0359-20131031/7331_1 /ASSEMBLY_ACC=CAM_ASM_000338 /TAXON_ID=268821 /ORGANISM="Scrippsiella Hangoei, Strain SHTV-5" /LENGTH=145 /DNA_ID=CAMNT_0050767419 /DNA_START=231 /DNA_END=668 /DNA_ORIENTATION=+